MPLLLRINHQKKDIIFQVITDKPSTQSKLEVFLNGQIYVFIKLGNNWSIDQLQHIETLDGILIEAIAKALALRFRVSSSQLV